MDIDDETGEILVEGTKVVNVTLDDGTVIVDPKVVTAFNDTHIAQMAGYLAITNSMASWKLTLIQASLSESFFSFVQNVLMPVR